MAKLIDKNVIYRIGIPTSDSQPGYAVLRAGSEYSIPGIDIISVKCKTWEDFFKKNPLKMKPLDKIFKVYTISEDESLQYVTEGQFKSPQSEQTNLADNIQYSPKVSELQRIIAANEERIMYLNGIIEDKNAEIGELKELNAEWLPEKLELEKKIFFAERDLEAAKENNEKSIQTLNDDFEHQREKDREKSQIAQLTDQIEQIKKAQEEKQNSLSGIGEIIAGVSVPILGKLMGVAMDAVNKRYPNAVPGILKSFGADATPTPEYEQELQQQQTTLDTAKNAANSVNPADIFPMK